MNNLGVSETNIESQNVFDQNASEASVAGAAALIYNKPEREILGFVFAAVVGSSVLKDVDNIKVPELKIGNN